MTRMTVAEQAAAIGVSAGRGRELRFYEGTGTVVIFNAAPLISREFCDVWTLWMLQHRCSISHRQPVSGVYR